MISKNSNIPSLTKIFHVTLLLLFSWKGLLQDQNQHDGSSPFLLTGVLADEELPGLVKMCLFYPNESGHARTDPILNQNGPSDHVHMVSVAMSFEVMFYFLCVIWLLSASATATVVGLRSFLLHVASN